MFLEGAMVYGFGRRLMFIMSWVRIPAPDTRWTFFHICRKNYFFCSKRPKITKKRQRMTYLKMFWSEDNNNSRWQKRKKVSSSNSQIQISLTVKIERHRRIKWKKIVNFLINSVYFIYPLIKSNNYLFF